MNKSKFLKKSLAMLLAVMLVVAMIPLSASAVSVGDDVLADVSAKLGTLKISGNSIGDTLNYSATEQEEELDVRPDKNTEYDTVYAGEVVDGTETVVYNETTNCKITVSGLKGGDVKTYSFFVANKTAYDADENTTKKSGLYTVTISVPPADTDISIKEATLGAEKIAGVVDNGQQTITFTTPWSYNFTEGGEVAITMTKSGTVEEDFALTGVTKDGVAQTVEITAQNGDKTTYSVYAYEAACLETFSIGGVKAVQDKDADDKLVEDKYTVTLPVGTKVGTDSKTEKELPITFTTAKAATAKLGTDTVENGKSYKVPVSADDAQSLTFTDKDKNEKTYEVKIVVGASNDTTISGFTAKVGGYKETGVVSGKKLSVVLPAGTTAEQLKAVELAFESAEGATCAIVGQSGPKYDLTKPVTVEITAADNKTVAYYDLTATVAEKVNTDPAITSVKMTIGAGDKAVEYTGTISGKTITFKVPYATTGENVTNAAYSWAITPATEINPIDFDETNIFKNTNKVAVTSDSGDKVTYTVVYTKETAETGKTISDISLTSAKTSDKVTAENTYKATISGAKVSVTLPFSLYNKLKETMTVSYKLPEGAKFYNTTEKDDAEQIYAALENGFDEEGNPQTLSTVEVENLINDTTNKSHYIVADETAAVLLDAAFAKDPKAVIKVSTLAAAPYKGHVTLYTIEAKQAAANTASTLKSVTDEKTNVTAKISGRTVEFSVPGSYVDGAEFSLDVAASTGATVKFGDGAVEEGKISLKVVKAGDVLTLKTSDNKDVSAITVTAEDGIHTTVYNTVKVTARAMETGAAITAVKVNKTNGTINGKTINVTLPFGTDITNVTVDITTSKMATLAGLPTPTVKEEVNYYDLREDVKLTVTSENGDNENKYTLKATVAPQFSDVKTGAWYYDYVTKAAAAGIIDGKGNGIFDPEGKILRGDFALMTVRMLGVDVSKYTSAPFSDVKSTDYYMKAIAYCAEKGIIDGVGDGKFDPQATITREAAAKIIAQALGLKGTTTETFKDDARIAKWAKSYVYACKKAGIFAGDDKGNFNPKASITRAEAAKVMVKSLDNK